MKVLFITPHSAESGTTRFRVTQFVPHLEAQGIRCEVRPFTSDSLRAVLHKPGHVRTKLAQTARGLVRRLIDVAQSRDYDVVYLVREALPFGPPVLELSLSRRAQCLILDFDDAVFLPIPVGHQGANRWLYRFKYGRNFESVLKAADRVVAGNEYLAGFARRHNSHVTVIPTVVDVSTYPRHRRNHGPVVIGFWGSPSTSSQLMALRDVFTRLSAAYGDQIKFLVHGDPDFPALVPTMTSSPFRLDTAVADINQFDIGLMPLADDDWTRGKCGAKALEYGAIGIPLVSSPVGVATEIVSHGHNGYLADSPDDWVRYLSRLIEDVGLREALGANLRQTVVDRYSVEFALPMLLNVLEGARHK